MSNHALDQSTAENGNHAFLDRFSGPAVTQQVRFGHALTLKFFRRTFSVTARNYYFLAVIAPTTMRERCAEISKVRNRLTTHLANAIEETRRDLAQLAPQQNAADSAEQGESHRTTVNAKLITPLSRQHLALLQISDAILLEAQTRWIEGVLMDTALERVQARVKRRLTAAALMAREACVQLLRGDNATTTL